MTAGNSETQHSAAGANGAVIHASDDDFDAQNVPTSIGDVGGARRASPYASPAVRSSLVNSRESTPTQSRRVTIDSLLLRPRSNPRTRTPMRYESPLSPQAFRREDPSPERVEEQRRTVRPMAGAPLVGTTLGARRVSFPRLVVFFHVQCQLNCKVSI